MFARPEKKTNESVFASSDARRGVSRCPRSSFYYSNTGCLCVLFGRSCPRGLGLCIDAEGESAFLRPGSARPAFRQIARDFYDGGPWLKRGRDRGRLCNRPRRRGLYAVLPEPSTAKRPSLSNGIPRRPAPEGCFRASMSFREKVSVVC